MNRLREGLQFQDGSISIEQERPAVDLDKPTEKLLAASPTHAR